MTITAVEVFDKIIKGAIQVDDVAGGLIQLAKENKCATKDEFNVVIYAGYDAKGWSYRIGRPQPGDVPAPDSIRTYVSEIRRAYDLDVKVLEMKSISELRKAIKSKKPAAAPATPAQSGPDELIGVSIKKANHLTGNLFHDVIVLWENLPESQQAKLEKVLRKAVAEFMPKAPPAIKTTTRLFDMEKAA